MGRTERDMLVAEANMPIEELMAKYSSAPGLLQERLMKEKHQSPMIKAAKKTGLTGKTNEIKTPYMFESLIQVYYIYL